MFSLCLGAELQAAQPSNMMRIFWQDCDTHQLSMADITFTNKWGMKRENIKGFPKLDPETQSLAQMKISQGVLLVGVRDQDNGTQQSGWVAVQTGVREEPHGNHSHWRYPESAYVTNMKLDADQGNPAHVYVYDNFFYVANDRKNGFTQLNPKQLQKKSTLEAAKFFPGGGNHITMAAVDNVVGYSSWIDGGGPHTGQVDVVDLRQQSDPNIAYSFQLPTGVIHGATQNSGKVFFAPTDGVCWVQADRSVKLKADTVQVNHMSLGVDAESDQPLRTGAFTTSRNWVLCTTGTADQAALCLIDAAAQSPSVVKMPISIADGLSLTTPKVVLSLGKRYAVAFQNRTDAESDVQEKLTIVALDPNRDRDFRDARVAVSLPVEASRIEGHKGHHDISFDAYGRYAVFTEPADGIINVFSMKDLQVVARFRVGGTPGSIVAVGAREWNH